MGFILDNCLQNLSRVTDFSQENVKKMIEHASYLIRYCKISMVICSGSGSLSKPGRFLLTK